ncbi:MAG: DUF6597 domain-containing transcriptional factor, partial [Planctomycetota bacterium]
ARSRVGSVVRYREITPARSIRRFVRCFWIMEGEPAERPQRVVPDGCPEIVLNRADPFCWTGSDGIQHKQDEELAVGQLRRAIHIEASGSIDLIGIRFEPVGLRVFSGVPMHRLVDRDVGLDEIDGRLAARLRSAARLPIPEAMKTLTRILAARFDSDRGASEDGWIAECAAGELASTDRPAVGRVARSLRVHRRSLERAFREHIGITPGIFRRVVRLRDALREAEAAPRPCWASLATRHGYTDQSHLIRESRLIAATTPQRHTSEAAASSF